MLRGSNLHSTLNPGMCAGLPGGATAREQAALIWAERRQRGDKGGGVREEENKCIKSKTGGRTRGKNRVWKRKKREEEKSITSSVFPLDGVVFCGADKPGNTK